MTPRRHYNLGKECNLCNPKNKVRYNRDEIESLLKVLYGDRYIFNLDSYKTQKSKIVMFCPVREVWRERRVGDLLNGLGCQCCTGRAKKCNKVFIKESKNVHGDRYDYSLVKYKNSNERVSVICKEHGVFNIVARNHLYSSQGCPSCSLGGYNRSMKGTFYITAWTYKGHTFLKYGITNVSALSRAKEQKKRSDYNFTILFEEEFEDGDIEHWIEGDVKYILKGNYMDKIYFPNGYTETLPFEKLPILLEILEDNKRQYGCNK